MYIYIYIYVCACSLTEGACFAAFARIACGLPRLTFPYRLPALIYIYIYIYTYVYIYIYIYMYYNSEGY